MGSAASTTSEPENVIVVRSREDESPESTNEAMVVAEPGLNNQIVLHDSNNQLNDDGTDLEGPGNNSELSLSEKIMGVMTIQKKSKPPPTFNLPVLGWNSDPDELKEALERKRKKLKHRPRKTPKVKNKSSRLKGSDGPVLDWACLSIRDIPSSDLRFLQSKTSVDLSHNPLNQLPVGFGTQKQLQHLTLHDCDFTLEGIPHSLYSGLQNLSVLDLSCNMLTEIPEYFGFMGSLKRLVIHSNRLFRIDDAIANCPLEHLEVQHNLLTSLPPGLIRLRKLTYLDAEHNNMDFLPIFFGRGCRGAQNTRNLQALQRMNLGSNYLTQLPPGLAGMDNLESLWLQRNYVSELPTHLGDMRGLLQLCAFGNQIKSLPDSCSGLVSLVTMALNDNRIGPLLPESMFGMTSLVSLDLSDNSIVSLPMRFGELVSLKHFWCSRNLLESLPSSIGSMTRLESLHLHENKLSNLPPNVGGLISLRVFTLARNQLEHLPPTFRLLASLQRVTLDHNTTITYINEGGSFFCQFPCLSAMTIDKSVFKLCDPSVKKWCKEHIVHLNVMNTPTSKGKLRAQLLEATNFKKGSSRHGKAY